MDRGAPVGVLALLGLGIAGCSGVVERGGPEGSIAVRGRVVDAESCASTAGCLGVADVVVSVWGEPERPPSAPTGADGAFVLEAPPDRDVHLLAAPAGSAAELAPTLNPMVVRPGDDSDLYGVELAVLSRAPDSLLTALRREGIDLLLGGGYVGQVVRVEGARVEAAAGVRVHVHPAPARLRFVAALPRYLPDEPLLAPETAETTGPFGIFVAEADRPRELVAVAPFADDVEYDLVVTPLPAGVVGYAVHRGWR